jgi:hypothetical protein
MSLKRRTFLATPLVFGLRDLLAQESSKPEWFQAALQRMKETGRLGVVLVAPDGREPQRRLGSALWILANEEHPEAHELFGEAVFVCVTADLAGRTVKGSGNRVLLDPDGKRIAQDTVEPELFEDPRRFVGSFRPFLRGESNERLRERAEAIEKGLPDEVRAALRNLDAEDPAEREKAAKVAGRSADRMVPYLTWISLTAASLERRGRAKDLLRRQFEAAPEDKPGARLPYGTTLPRFVGSCAGLRAEDEGVPKCGLSEAPIRARKFIRFLNG